MFEHNLITMNAKFFIQHVMKILTWINIHVIFQLRHLQISMFTLKNNNVQTK